MGQSQHRGIIMYKAHSASTIVYDQDHLVGTKHLVLAGVTAQSVMIAPNNMPSKSELSAVPGTERSLFYWSRAGAVLGAMWGLIFYAVVVPMPGISADVFAGPLASWIAVVVQDAIMFGLISALCAGLLRIATRRETPSSNSKP